jgi:hypothetical protein
VLDNSLHKVKLISATGTIFSNDYILILKCTYPKLFTLTSGLRHLISSDVKGTAKYKLELTMTKCSESNVK